jgi:alkylhydroperoxidase/carboxymuconolactone decarboxylase family protein YurZ
MGPVDRVKSVSAGTADAFGQLRRSIDEAGPLAPKHRELINIAAFTVARIEGGFRTHCGRALDAGATPDEVRQTVLLTFGSCMGVGPTADALRWAEEVIASKK